ncbi:RNA-directed DNA polymerase Tps5.2 [Scheffersomyces stipitis CBS 6054]|uniref:RNA-directed DNA polymerase Tps5.2 n=1 Tax=Scheffersomyces stipitis (strain ATCC 58785 / CBS 6054 / NBRC 10063 / NRRL Y-11545) TaxID=322104 RepID=A3LYU7_PICST|nr:RNA-directed DNA polymerase Tps5.2 [Scheffersomyces stipitis CBS 6054]ABN68228.2 RNA-directed DNA polymerase Tps5.2 [Scheffersomyces stipitis CBS 6054]
MSWFRWLYTQNLLTSAVTTTGDKLVISHDDIVHPKYGQLATRDSRNLYLSCLEIVSPSTVSRANHSAYSATAPVSASALVHARLGHPSPTVVRSALKYPNMPRTAVHDSISCEACLSSKSTRVIPKTTTGPVTFAPLQLLHCDLSGPHAGGPSSLFYFCILLDDFTRFKAVGPILKKSDAADFIIKVIKAWTNHFSSRGGYRVCNFRSDNGGEFVNSTLTSFFAAEGSQTQLTVPGNSHQNGRAERAIRSVLDKTRTMITASSLPSPLYPHALQHAAFLLNRLPTPVLQNRPPFELWHGARPILSQLKVFGCAAFVNVPPNHRQSKLVARAIKGVYLGSDPFRKAHLVYDLATRQVITSSHVRFQENVFLFARPSTSTVVSATSIGGGGSGGGSFPSISAPAPGLTQGPRVSSPPSPSPPSTPSDSTVAQSPGSSAASSSASAPVSPAASTTPSSQPPSTPTPVPSPISVPSPTPAPTSAPVPSDTSVPSTSAALTAPSRAVVSAQRSDSPPSDSYESSDDSYTAPASREVPTLTASREVPTLTAPRKVPSLPSTRKVPSLPAPRTVPSLPAPRTVPSLLPVPRNRLSAPTAPLGLPHPAVEAPPTIPGSSSAIPMEIDSTYTEPESMSEDGYGMEVVSDQEFFDAPEQYGTHPRSSPLISTRSSMDVSSDQEEYPDPSTYMDIVVMDSDDFSSYHDSEMEDASDMDPLPLIRPTSNMEMEDASDTVSSTPHLLLYPCLRHFIVHSFYPCPSILASDSFAIAIGSLGAT